MIHDKENAHRKLIRELKLESIVYDSREIKKLSDKDNPMNRIHYLLKNFLYAHESFDRDKMQGYLNLFTFVMNPPVDNLKKMEILLDLAFENSKTLRYHEFYGLE